MRLRSSMKTSIGIGICGLGGAGRAHLVRFVKHPLAQVIGVYDPNRHAAESFLQQYEKGVKIKLTDDWEEFLSLPGIEAVSICSPDYLHAVQIVDALAAAKHVLCEKPLTTSTEECFQIIRAAQASDTVCSVHHQMRFVPAFARAKALADAGALGDIFAVDSDYYHDMRERATHYDYWRVESATVQNIVFGGMSHCIDLQQWVLGERPEEVFAYAGHQAWPAYPDVDYVTALLRYPSGAIGRATMSIGCSRPQDNTLTILGNRGVVSNGVLFNSGGSRGFIHIPPIPSPLHGGFLAGLARGVTGRILSLDRGVCRYPYNHYEHNVACTKLIDRFLHSVYGQSCVPVTVEESALVIVICEATINSYIEGMPVTISYPGWLDSGKGNTYVE